MAKIAHLRRSISFLVGLLLVGILGCDSADHRLVELSERSLARQAEQNHEISKQSQQVAQAAKELVAADAQARRELVAAQAQLQHELQAERESLDHQHDRLETERKELAIQRHRDPLVAAAIVQAATILACLLPIVLCFVILHALRRDASDPAVDEVLIQELTRPQLFLAEQRRLPVPSLENRSQPPEQCDAAE